MDRILEFFEDELGRLSMIRLVILLAAVVSSGFIFVVGEDDRVEALITYVGAWGFVGMNSKWQETRPKIAEAQAKAAPAVINQDSAVNNVDASSN